MNKVLLTSILLTASLSSYTSACDFHEDGYFSRYHFPRVNPEDPSKISQADLGKIESSVVSESGVKKRIQPDFRYTSVRTTNKIKNITSASP